MIERKRAAALDAALSAMFRLLKGRGVPDHIRATVDELERAEQVEPPSRKRA